MDKNERVIDEITYVKKKPLYHQGLFWGTVLGFLLSLVLGLLLIFSILTSVSLEEENEQLVRMTGVSPYRVDRTYHDFATGVSVEDPSGEKVTVNQIQVDGNRAMTDEATGRAVLVNVTVENVGKSNLLVNPYTFDLVSQEGDLYVLDGSTFDKVSVGTNLKPGEKLTFDLIFDGEEDKEERYGVVHKDNRWGLKKSLASSK